MPDTSLQDGMLLHYQSQARASDVNVEARLEREPFDYRAHLAHLEKNYPSQVGMTYKDGVYYPRNK